jgi:hypothetical protein
MKAISTCKLERQKCETDKNQNVVNSNEHPNILFRQPHWTDILFLHVLQKLERQFCLKSKITMFAVPGNLISVSLCS